MSDPLIKHVLIEIPVDNETMDALGDFLSTHNGTVIESVITDPLPHDEVTITYP